ncbi:hypothetical protein [Aeromonas molluscorum]|uniref:hypothetical protein n=1 Tax=Aeromonas molluscorum TaxID=271417 RepID=UPI0012682D7D|nr:hypothetical protein [Aeromonas molluscorum]
MFAVLDLPRRCKSPCSSPQRPAVSHPRPGFPESDDPHLRSFDAIMGYRIKATDGDVGHVESLLINPIHYLVINTSNRWMGHNELIASDWIGGGCWLDKTVSVGLDVAALKSSPVYESAEPLNREREDRLYDHHGRSGYWLTETIMARVET